VAYIIGLLTVQQSRDQLVDKPLQKFVAPTKHTVRLNRRNSIHICDYNIQSLLKIMRECSVNTPQKPPSLMRHFSQFINDLATCFDRQ